jgi:hypothetical protein
MLYPAPQRQHGTMARISRSRSMQARIQPISVFVPLGLALLPAFLLHSAASRAQVPTRTARTGSTDPTSLPAHDSHQGLLIAADPYTSADRYKDKFGKHSPYEAGIVAIDVFFRNDNDLPIRINLKTMQLQVSVPGGSRQRLDPLSPADVADRVLTKSKDPTPRFPVPRIGAPRPKHDKNWEEFAGAVRDAAVASDLLAPHATTHGFLYFDIDRHYEWISDARLEIPDLAFMNNSKPLFFFEIDLAPGVR